MIAHISLLGQQMLDYRYMILALMLAYGMRNILELRCFRQTQMTRIWMRPQKCWTVSFSGSWEIPDWANAPSPHRNQTLRDAALAERVREHASRIRGCAKDGIRRKLYRTS
jgi:hypothetical protein